MRIALDSNVLAYAEGVNGAARRSATLALLERLDSADVVIPVQALGETFNVLVKKARRSRSAARDALIGWRDAYPVVETSSHVMVAATDLAADHQLGIWDAVMLAAASASACRIILSEDLQEGFTWGGVTVVNPFSTERHPLLEALLGPN